MKTFDKNKVVIELKPLEEKYLILGRFVWAAFEQSFSRNDIARIIKSAILEKDRNKVYKKLKIYTTWQEEKK